MKKRFLAILLTLCMALTLFPETAWAADIIASGTCGKSGSSLNWSLDSSGTLTISGTGEMEDYGPGNSAAPWSTYSESIRTLTFEDGITRIGKQAFFTCSNLDGSLTIPNTVTSIGKYAFSGLNFTGTLQLSENLTTIEDEAFYSCDGFSGTLSIPSSVRTIGELAFAHCYGFEKIVIPNGVTSIGEAAFEFCYGVDRGSLTVPASVSSLGAFAFSHMGGITEFLVESGNTHYSVKDGVLFDKTQRTLVMYPDEKAGSQYIIPDGVTEIADGAFEDSGNSVWVENLRSVVFPASISKIGYFAFVNCGCNDYYFKGNAPSIEKLDVFSSQDTLYYVLGTIGWTDSDAYDKEAGTWNGYKLKTWDGIIPGGEPEPPSSGDNSYYALTENRLFRVYALNSSYPCPVGFTVGVGEASYTGYQSGNHFCDDITAVIPESYSGNIVVSKDGYYPYQIPAELTDNSNAITMVPTSITGPFSQALLLDSSYENTKRYSNLLVEGTMIYESTLMGDNTDILNLYPIVNWNGHGEGKILLVQGEKQVELKNNTFNEVNVAVCRFVANEPVYLQVLGADGVQTQIETGIHIYERWKSGISIDLGSALEIDTEDSEQEEVDIFAGESFKLDFSSLSDSLVPISFSIKDDGTVTGTIGLTFDDGSYKEAAFGEIKEMLTRMADPNQTENLHGVASYLSKLKKEGIKPASSHSSWGVSGDVQIIGYFSGNIKDGRIGLTETKMALVLEGSASYTWNTFVAEVPAYIKVALKAQLETYLKMVYDEQFDKLISDGKQTLKGSLGLSAEAGPGWEGYVSVGIKGSGNVTANSVIPISKDDTSFSMQADLSVVGSLAGIRGSWKLISSPEMVFWDAGEWCWKEKDSGKRMTQFVPDLDINSMRFFGAGDSIADGVSGYTAPALARISGDRLLAVWIADVEGRSAVDKGGVYYSVLDNGTWSQPELVYDDNTNDSVPQLYQRNGVTYLAWQNYTTAFNTDTLPDYDTLIAQLENVTSQFDPDSNQWNQPVVETPDWYLADIELPTDYEDEWPITSTTRQVIDYNSIRTVLYTAADEDGQYQVYGIFDSGDGWGDPVQVTEAPEGVNGFSVILDESDLSILYTTGDLSAASLVIQTSAIEADLTVNYADYLPETLVPNNTLTLAVSLQNSGPISIDGAHISVLINGNEVYQENVDVALKSGEKELLFIGYDLPEEIEFTSLDVKVMPISGDDADLTDNIATCTLSLYDLSLENASAIQAGNATQVLTQIVNRGQTVTAPVTMTFHRGTSDGEVIGKTNVPALSVGELVNLTVELSGLNAGDMVYAELETLSNENLVSNNSSQATVIKSAEVTVNSQPGTTQPGIPSGPNTPSSGNSSGGSNSSIYSINVSNRVTGGTVTVRPTSASEDQKVTITISPNSGYKVGAVAVTDKNGKEITVTDAGDGKYIFIMPNSKVDVKVEFVRQQTAPSFTDVQPGTYYADAVAWAVEKSITAGTSATTFSPNAPCTRAQIVTFLWRTAGSPKVTASCPFTDVPVDSYYYDAVLWAVEQDITSGTSATTFSPNTTCTRAQAVTFLYRYEKSPAVSGSNAFTDVAIDAYYSNAVQWAVDKNVTAGTSATTFSPNETCTRGQIVTFLYRDMA